MAVRDWCCVMIWEVLFRKVVEQLGMDALGKCLMVYFHFAGEDGAEGKATMIASLKEISYAGSVKVAYIGCKRRHSFL